MRAAYGLSRSPAVLLRGVQTTPRRVVVGRRPTPGRLPPPPCEATPGRRSLRTGTSRQALDHAAVTSSVSGTLTSLEGRDTRRLHGMARTRNGITATELIAHHSWFFHQPLSSNWVR